MLAVRRSAARAAQASRASLSRQSRRHAHDAHHDSHHAGPKEEHFSTGFYVAVGLIPTAVLFYGWTGSASDPGRKPYLTRMIDAYAGYRDTWAERNKLHTDMIEQAAFDRNLFLNSTPRRHVDLNFPEAFNTGSPFNVPAGSQADITKVVAHYEQKNYEENAKKLEALKNGTLKAEQSPSQLGGRA
ncbi:hypothetical protein GTA08_BOTSDO02680 [Neofusicoccum parvum]|uniref:Uncharacterized protein n=1 Tax=Neofusicoccum parvum TaxID=310453 RepID=A0ACB5RPD3_9PEZI|nr:hypothetical protein GTA08_BOTSDO02680 [Neofusicoccum parvum]GME48763.1 hypothetical protein GTA08_BOTSDO02680 [Neofusicoccum parvum]